MSMCCYNTFCTLNVIFSSFYKFWIKIILRALSFWGGKGRFSRNPIFGMKFRRKVLIVKFAAITVELWLPKFNQMHGISDVKVYICILY